MKSKHLFQIITLLAILVGALGTGQPVQAQSGTVQIVTRNLTIWDAIYTGYVDTTQYEKWPLDFVVPHTFTVTATPTSGALSPLILLLDGSNNELARSVGRLTSTQPVGTYYIQIQPETSTGGTYTLTIREVQVPTPTSTSTSTSTPTPTATSSTPTLTPTSTFTPTPTPTATSSTPTPTSTSSTPTSTPTSTSTPIPTPVTSFVSVVLNPTSLEVGETSTAIVSLNNVPAAGYTSVEFTCTYNPSLVEASNIVANTDLFGADPVVAINGPLNGSFIVAIAGSNGNKAVEDGAAFTFNVKGLAAGQASIECRARVSTGSNVLSPISFTGATLTITPVVVDGTLTGKVLACKPVTVSLDSQQVTADASGNFSFTAPAGTYTVIAGAQGFLNAQGSATLTGGATTTMPQISLSAGDINNNGVVDQFDALTIGMSYNTTTPAAADLNCDSNINVLDLELLAGNYRKVGPIAWQ
jgi:hypothetical protein